MSSTPTVIILGASYCGIPIAHTLVRNLPENYHVTLVSPSTHLYWNIAAPRAVVKNHAFSKSNSDCFVPIQPGFAQYPASRFTFVQGRATALDPATHKVTITRTDDNGVASAPEVLTFNHVIIATGGSVVTSTGELLPFKNVGSHIETQQALETIQTRIGAARTIVISGAGPTGVETAGEIASLWPEKKVTIVFPGSLPLSALREDVSRCAQKQLESLGVQIKSGVTAVEDGEGIVKLSDGTTLEAELHIPTHGLDPNTSFVPAEMKTKNGSVLVTPGMRAQNWPDVWAVGDAADVKVKSKVAADSMCEIMVTNLLAVINGKEPGAVHKDELKVIMVPVGGKFAMGTGQFGSWRIWGFLIWLAKGRSYFINMSKSMVDGKNIKKQKA